MSSTLMNTLIAHAVQKNKSLLFTLRPIFQAATGFTGLVAIISGNVDDAELKLVSSEDSSALSIGDMLTPGTKVPELCVVYSTPFPATEPLDVRCAFEDLSELPPLSIPVSFLKSLPKQEPVQALTISTVVDALLPDMRCEGSDLCDSFHSVNNSNSIAVYPLAYHDAGNHDGKYSQELVRVEYDESLACILSAGGRWGDEWSVVAIDEEPYFSMIEHIKEKYLVQKGHGHASVHDDKRDIDSLLSHEIISQVISSPAFTQKELETE